jgi:hypothetical protein
MDRGQFAVGSLTLEFRATRANAALMRQLAQRSGGTAFAPANADDLPIQLAQSETFAPVALQNERDRELWHVSWFLAAIIALLAAEWTLRKRRGMV